MRHGKCAVSRKIDAMVEDGPDSRRRLAPEQESGERHDGQLCVQVQAHAQA
jgi:hypothetical protein